MLTPGEYMKRALDLAREAAMDGEVPVGAVLVMPDGTVFEDRNRAENESPLHHAETGVLNKALSVEANRQSLNDAVLYVTLEPCIMCLGAMIHARIGGLVYACQEPRFGSVDLLEKIWNEKRYPYRFPVTMAGDEARKESEGILKDFFKAKRNS